jgi:hypothetical protein
MDWQRLRRRADGEFISCSLTILVIARAAPSPASLRSFSSDAVYTGTDKSFDTVSSTLLKEADSFCARFWATAARLSAWVRTATRKNIERIRTFIETPRSGVLFHHHDKVRASLQGVRPRPNGIYHDSPTVPISHLPGQLSCRIPLVRDRHLSGANFVHRLLACVKFYCGILTNLSETTLLKGS